MTQTNSDEPTRPPPVGVDKQKQTTFTDAQSAQKQFPSELDVLSQRRTVGYLLAGAGILCVIVVGVLAYWRLGNEAVPNPPLTGAIVGFGLKLLADVLVSVALVYFSYQLLRISERMLLPAWWISAANVEVVRAMTGIETPAATIEKSLKPLADVVAGAIRKNNKDKGDD